MKKKRWYGPLLAYGKACVERLVAAVCIAGAALGITSARIRLGWCYRDGKGVKQDYARAAACWKDAIAQGNAKAQYAQGWACINSKDAEERQKTLALWEAAVAQGHPKAQYALGKLYKEGELVNKNYTRAHSLWEAAAAQGNARAQYSLGWCYDRGVGVKKDLAKTIAWWKKAAALKNAKALYCLGWCYSLGKGVNKDLARAVACWKKAAAQNHVESTFNMGWCYESGTGVKPNWNKALHWYKRAAELNHQWARAGNHNMETMLKMSRVQYWNINAAKQGSLGAQFRLGKFYIKTKNAAKAHFWLKSAAMNGHIQAQHRLSYYYAKGLGFIQQDLGRSIYWAEKAAAQGYKKAQIILGWSYLFGKGVRQNWEKAISFFVAAGEGTDNAHLFHLKSLPSLDESAAKGMSRSAAFFTIAAEQGDKWAQYLMGRCFLFGSNSMGVKKDEEKGIELLTKAAKQGISQADVIIKRLNKNLSAASYEEDTPDSIDASRQEDPTLGCSQPNEQGAWYA